MSESASASCVIADSLRRRQERCDCTSLAPRTCRESEHQRRLASSRGFHWLRRWTSIQAGPGPGTWLEAYRWRRQHRPSADNADMEMAGVIAGLGFAQLADYMAAPLIQSGVLQRVMEAILPRGACTSIGHNAAQSHLASGSFRCTPFRRRSTTEPYADDASPTSALTPSKAGKR